jgi:hypothetical protein
LNWEAISGVAEVVGALAVVVTLIYLSRQIGQNTAALRSTATQAASEQASEMYRTLAVDPELPGIFVRGLPTPDKLSAEETARFNSIWMSVLFNIQNWYLQTQDGFLDGSLLASWARIMTPITAEPGFRAFWEQRRHIYTPEFQRFLEGLASDVRDPDYSPLGVRVSQSDHRPVS